ncbi:hypothetical protein [Shewanella frigidimarina]|uniref:hypothetical protein n=1 Tax=Shewanella frigidimarina TaxID=56812 RepID=UPI003D796ECE
MDLSKLGGSGGIKSIQRGLVSLNSAVNNTVDITVSAVNMSKSTLNCINFGIGSQYQSQGPSGHAHLFSETKIRFFAVGSFASTVGWELIEYV